MLRIYDDALHIVRRLVPDVEAIRRRQPSLADQLDRAGDSTVLGIAEGSRSTSLEDPSLYRIVATRFAVPLVKMVAAYGETSSPVTLWSVTVTVASPVKPS